MTGEASAPNPETEKPIGDNDRKFIVEAIDSEYLTKHTKTSYYLITDWLETNDDDETKLTRKLFENGNVELLYITKEGPIDGRQAIKTKITEERFQELLKSGMPHVEKMRYELEVEQNGIKFKAKYDVFKDSSLNILEIDANSPETRKLFRPELFDFHLVEVSDDESYHGYRIAKKLEEIAAA